ncbi:acyltransferase [Mesonia mobilis]|uniref:Acyltransferase n=1 Tax=Mesonia mobilis TaxID=369791 RepID=A0ABQ3BT60_9FLAO|nr:acyltransferase [Mesonia mobilis]MBQ0736952.1 acyltransferase [Aquimarina celericrescens]GGZ56857.1 acyltransferase [Mesonia mobilis]
MAKGSVFHRFKNIINFFVWLDSFLPDSINKFILILFRNIPFKLGVLIRYILLRNLSISCGDNVIIYEGVIFDAIEMMSFGNNVSINPNCYLAGEITIGSNVSIAHTSAFHSFNHTWSDTNLPINENPLYSNRIVIENDIWIACNCVILSGVRLHTRTVVAAGAIVTKSYPGCSLLGGNPARIIKNI